MSVVWRAPPKKIMSFLRKDLKEQSRLVSKERGLQTLQLGCGFFMVAL